jgi:thiol-disulfide isomerase/thioredoxin
MVFWATWCKACKKEWPKLQEISTRYAEGDQRPTWASVSLGEPADRVAKVAEERNLPGMVLYDPKERNGKSLGIDFVPTVCILDSRGRVAYNGPPKIKTIDKLLAKLTSEPKTEEEQP